MGREAADLNIMRSCLPRLEGAIEETARRLMALAEARGSALGKNEVRPSCLESPKGIA
jgi:hypothetical protein